MFAGKPRTEFVIRVVLTVIILLNALTPTTAAAMTASSAIDGESNSASSAPLEKLERLVEKITEFLHPSGILLVEGTPVVTDTATPEPLTTPTATDGSATLDQSGSQSLLQPLAVPETPVPDSAPSMGQPSTVMTLLPDVTLEFLATPGQAKAGDQVTFSLKISNNGKTPVSGFHFSNHLPDGFTFISGGNKSLSFDARTGILTWDSDQGMALQPGETLNLNYTVILAGLPMEAGQLVDTASLSADGLANPVLMETTLTLLGAGNSLTALDAKGGNAFGLNGHIQLNFPEKSLNASELVSIQDLGMGKPDANSGEPWLKFQLGLHSAQVQELSSTLSDGSPSPEKDRLISLKSAEAKFDKPVELTVSFDGLTDLAALGAEQAPYLVTLDEDSGTWVRVPLKSIDRESNRITAELTHFSTWGVGLGSAFPNGAGALLFDKAYTSLFNGHSQYSIPIWTPAGRNGMAPSLALSYSSGTEDGVLGDVQAPWVGMGWNVDEVEIVRKITNGGCSPCGGGSYGYENKFLLLFNGTGYELIPDGTTAGRYHTKAESFLYIQLHNDNLGNNSPAASNGSGEWWEVVEKDGTRWRLGWNADSEQLSAMKGYPGAASGTWATLGYAGHATNVVAGRWRVDQATDVYGNRMTFAYSEENRLVAGTSTNYDRASYTDTISYTSHTSGTPASGYSVLFTRESRAGNDVPAAPADWDNWDTYRLDRIDVKYGTAIIRTYDLGYVVRSYTDDGKTWQTTVLDSVAVSGSTTATPVVTTSAPTITFSYVDQNNRANCGAGCQEWAYPRLSAVASGWGGTASFTYGNDGRPSTSWYNWRVESLSITDGISGNSPMKTTFAYSTPCYNDTTAGWCNAGNTGELIGYAQTTTATRNFSDTANLASTVHKFYTDEQKSGREYETQNQDGSGTILGQSNVSYTVVTTGLPTNGYFTYANQVDQYLRTTTLTQVRRVQYQYDTTTTGNLTLQKEFDGSLNLYRQTAYQYVTNTSPSVWILDTLSSVALKDASGVILSEQDFGYGGNLPGTGSPTTNKPDLSRVVSGTQTIDAKFVYDTYGNLLETRLYKSYGATGSQPSGTYLTYSNTYDTTLKTYPVSATMPLIPSTTAAYDYGLGIPTSMTDPNSNTTSVVYDGLGRATSITYPGYAQANVKYTYPTPTGTPLTLTAPYAFKMEIWDETASLYRAAWQMMDGLGRVVQTQSPYETAGYLVLSDTSYNAQGLTLYSGLPRTYNGAGGSYYSPSWGSVAHSTSSYDALARITSVAYPDGSSESQSYSGLRVTSIDQNSHQKVYEQDAFGRLIKVEEYTGSNPYTLYATTTYGYDERNLLKLVTDAAGNQTSMSYNGFGRKYSMTDPDMGTWGYGYDVFGNMNSQTDARGCVTSVLYDDLNRPTQKSYSGLGACATTSQVNYTYDSVTGGNEGLGRRTGMTDGSGSSSWFYNVLGQVTSETHNIDGTNYTSSATFDAFGRPLTQTLPSAEVLTYAYNAMGALSGLSGTNTYVSNIHHAASGQVTDQALGNGLIQQSCYEANTLRLSSMRVYSGSLQSCVSSPSSPRLNLSYSYQSNGNVSQVVDGTRGETLNYTYDELDRLLNVSGPYNYSYTYNAIGNITGKSMTTIPLSVGAGYWFTCSKTGGTGVECWGRNGNGQLGDGTLTQRNTPVDVSGLSTGVTAVVPGKSHACALTSAGGVKCWGDNSNGQLGDGTTAERTTPVDVSGLTSGVTAVSAGAYYTCALTTSGGVKCWGYNLDGQLGDGTTTDRSTPVNVSGLTSGVAAISTGFSHTCALTTGGAVKCWGDNSSGQLGDGTTTDRLTPVDVSGLSSGVVAISAGGSHTCALTSTGEVKCWGRNNNGQLGDGTTTNRTTPVSVSGLSSGVSAITTGSNHSCALTTSGGVKCWGRNLDGELGDGTTTQRTTPVDVSGLTSGAASVDTSNFHTCTLTTGNVSKCWGDNTYGQLGDGTFTDRLAPVNTLFTTSTSYTYGDSTHKHAVTSLNSGESYTYDANGNMVTRVEGGLTYTQTFDAENRLVSVTVSGQTTQFIYDGDGNLVKKINPGGSKTIYVGGIYEVDKTSGGTVTRTVTYYPAGGAMRINSTLYYVLKDHLGSASVVTDATGNTVGEQRYYPYGETRLTTGTIYTDRLFTGQREMTGLGIYHFGARFYSPRLGRFLSADSIVPGFSNPQAFNRYSYVLGNPLKYTDPTGHGQCQTKQDCADMGTTPMGGGGTSGGSGGGSSNGGGDEEDPAPDPNPLGLPPPPPPPPSPIPTIYPGSKYPDIIVVVMPEGQPPSQDRTPEQKAGATIASAAGIVMDVVETGLALLPQDAGPVGEYVASFIDVGVTATGCFLNGLCFVGRPAPNLPPMLVVNQDLLLTTGEFLAPLGGAAVGFGVSGGNPGGAYVGSVGTDIVTSVLSVGYDIGRMTDSIPNVVSVGITFDDNTNHFQTYVFITPP
jgi:RHS repeat-associated protein/uncharacterized repeat protein (TIGR01451 family)